MLLYVLAHAALGFYVKKDSTPTSQNLEKTETERQNSALSPKEEANAATTATEQNPTKDTTPPLETTAQEKETKQETKQEQEKENDSKQDSVLPVQNDQKTPTTPTTPTMGKKPLEYKVAVSGVNVRAFPSTKGKIIGSLIKNKSVKVLEIQNDWAEIEFSHEAKGYVFLKLLKKAE
ncbi:SH3 domain-containing protein [Helicobacter pylori]